MVLEFRTIIDIEKPRFEIEPCERILFVGSCFADRIGRRFQEERFPVTVNPYGVMYNPASVLHTIERTMRGDECGGQTYTTAVLTLGTNHVYIEKATGEIVDNCRKRPQRLFEERKLSVEECEEYLIESIDRGAPVLVEWIDWYGHWQTIIGIDTCETESLFDDVLIMADSLDIKVHRQLQGGKSCTGRSKGMCH